MKKILYPVIPFLFFIIGYSTLSLVYRQKSFSCPSFVGKTITDAATEITSIPLNMRIIEEHVHDHLPGGTIMYQKPQGGQMIKPYQTLFLILSRKEAIITTPSFINLSLTEAQEIIKVKNLRYKHYMIESIEPKGTVIAQHPQANSLSEDKNIILYVSNGGTALRTLPSFKGLTLTGAQELCAPFPLVTIKKINQDTQNNRPCSDDIIENQKPLAGSIVNITKPLLVYVY